MKVAPDQDHQAHNSGEGQRHTIGISLMHTSQHYDEKMSMFFLLELGIPAPDINLGVIGFLAVQTANVIESQVCERKRD